MYTLIRTRDGAGDSGGMSCAVTIDENNKLKYESNARPRIGVRMQVGSNYARSFQSQDWWMTTNVTKILHDEENKVIFETENGSEYTWTKR